MKIEKRIADDRAVTPALEWLESMVRRGLHGGPVVVTIDRPRRTIDQNSKLWALLQDVALQVEWHGVKLSKDDWKDIFTAALKKQRTVPGIDGGIVVLGESTSRMNKQELSELIEFIYSFGADNGVQWSSEENHE